MSDGDRQLEQLGQVLADYPTALRMIDSFRRDRGKALSDWPNWCFLPMAGAHAIVSAGGLMPPDRIPDIARLAALTTWHYTRGIYRIHPRLLDALLHSPLHDHLPVEVFFRLPEWCVYIDLPPQPGLRGGILHGYYAHLEYDMNTTRAELRLLVDEDPEPYPLILHIGDWSILEATTRAGEEAARQGAALGLDITGHWRTGTVDMADALAHLLSPLIYLCSDARELHDPRRPHLDGPRRPRPVKSHQAWKLRTPASVTTWQAGHTLGEALPDSPDSPVDGIWDGRWDDHHRYRYTWLSTAGTL